MVRRSADKFIDNSREVEVASDRKSGTVVLRETWLLYLDMAYSFFCLNRGCRYCTYFTL